MNPARPADVEAAGLDAAIVSEFRRDLRTGLRAREKRIPSKYLYDARGSQLFEEICALPEYYPTRTETEIISAHAEELARLAGERCALVELGSGSSRKTRVLLDHLPDLVGYVPVDISGVALDEAAEGIRWRHPALEVVPLCHDFSRDGWRVPQLMATPHRRVFFFPGSTIGNFTPREAQQFLCGLRGRAEAGDALLVGVDLVKDARVLEAAYNDRAGVTAAFNRNVLVRANRELGADFAVGQFRHRAIFNQAESRIEMHLVSTTAQRVHLEGEWLASFGSGESVTTEYSCKYTVDGFRRLADHAGFTPVKTWTDPRHWFSVHWCVAR